VATLGSVVNVYDPAGYLLGLVTVLAASVIAAFIPAMRAARIDPARTLRSDS
jgi:ABC-type antimicrobial peptide transport system permease subunit